MTKRKVKNLALTIFLFAVALFCVTFTFSSNCMSQVPYFYPQNPLFSAAPYFPALPIYNPVPLPLFPPISPYPLPVPLTRTPAATIIITNPTTGTVSITTTAPATTVAPTAAVSPIVSGLISLYAQAIYSPTSLSVANPLLFAYISSLIL